MRSILSFSLALLTLALGGPPAGAETLLTERRVVLHNDIDFFGGDLEPIFETSFDNCRAQCVADARCRAFTYNVRSRACFPKSGVNESQPFQGAVSGRVLDTAGAALKQEGRRIDSLSFMDAAAFEEARSVWRGLQGQYMSPLVETDVFVNAAGAARDGGNLPGAVRFMGAAVALSDRADLWAELSRLAGLVNPSDYQQRRDLERLRTASAIHAYVRAVSPGGQATALSLLAEALEARGQGRDSIPVLRLSQSIAPRLETAQALDRALGLFGFRITEHEVDNNALTPRVCVTFSEALKRNGVNFTDYVRTPAHGAVATASGNQLCIEGLVHGETYDIAFRAGIPAESGEVTHKTVPLTFYIRDRDPSVHFAGRGYVLPLQGEAGIPVVTVNLRTVDLKLYRVDTRALSAVQRAGMLGGALSPWEEEELQGSLGAVIWEGVGEVGTELNRDVTTRLPVGDLVGGLEPGIFALRARVPGEDPYDAQGATQWFVVSDLGVQALSGPEKLTVLLRRLSDLSPLAGASVSVIARNNAILGSAASDGNGTAVIPAGLLRGQDASAPAFVMVETEGDFTYLSLTETEFDLSDRGVAGRAPSGPVDVFMTTERGAYRPGETVHATVLVRDDRALAIPGLPVTAIVKRPDGVEAARLLLADAGAGGRVMDFDLPEGAHRGTWTVAVHADTGAAPLQTAKFAVEDFLPERIDFELDLGPGPVPLAPAPWLEVRARYLYGAPGAGLRLEGEAFLSGTSSLASEPGFRFGRHDQRFDRRGQSFDGGWETGEDGTVTIPVEFDLPQDPTGPLEITAVIRLSEGSGRPVERRISAPAALTGPVIGIRPLFDGSLREGATASFEVIGLDAGAGRTAINATWTLNRVETRYQWYRLYGSWRWEATTRRTRVASGELITGGKPVQIDAGVDWGRYELIVESTSGPLVASSVGFGAGWYAPPDSASTPDTLEMSLDAPVYRSGETATLVVDARSEGVVQVSVIGADVIEQQAVAVVEGENRIPLAVTPDWGTGAYVTATFLRPAGSATQNRGPTRAIGVAWAKVDPGERALSARLETADEIRPNGPLDVTLAVDGAKPGQPVFATIAAVDVGVLNITGFQSPDPSGHYFGQRRLGVGIRDLYGRLIDAALGDPGRLRSGGDAVVRSRFNSPPQTERLVAYFSGPLTVGPDGRVSTSFDMPAFNGTVRLMAVVWSGEGVGQAERDVLVRDPVVMTLSAPRFLAPGDTSRLRIDLAHVEGESGSFGLSVATAGDMRADTVRLPRQVVLGPRERTTIEVPLIVGGIDDPEVVVTLTSPSGRDYVRRARIPVRAHDPEVSRTLSLALGDGETFRMDANVFDGLRPGSARATVAAGVLARIDVPGLLQALDRYPYGCTEQITSRAMPLLYVGNVAEAVGIADGQGLSARIEDAIAQVLDNQSSSGSFGLWRPDNGDLWLDAYVTDFLSRARERGFAVPDRAFRLALLNLRNRVNYAPDIEEGGEDIAYALLVMAREGAASMGDLRYYADARSHVFATPLALAQIGAGLASYGDQARADKMFRLAAAKATTTRTDADTGWRTDYGSVLRDAAGVVALAAEAGSRAVDYDALTARLAPGASPGHRSTQENMWGLLAANALIEATPRDAFEINGVPADGPVAAIFDGATGHGADVAITNRTGRTERLVLTTFGQPLGDAPAGGNGFTIERFAFTPDGEPVRLDEVALNQRLVIVLKVDPHGYAEGRLMVNDPLPAGFEIDNPNLIRSGDVAALDWLDLNIDPVHAEFRTERFLAAVDWRSDAAFQVAYMVRAVSPGTFHAPAASVEDMYRPTLRARTATGRIVIAE